MAEEGMARLHGRLKAVDPVSAARIHPNDPQRILRALEVYLLSGKTLTEWQAQSRPLEFPFQVLELTLAPGDRGVLHERIALRFDQMLEQGFLAEMRGLLENPCCIRTCLPCARSDTVRRGRICAARPARLNSANRP